MSLLTTMYYSSLIYLVQPEIPIPILYRLNRSDVLEVIIITKSRVKNDDTLVSLYCMLTPLRYH